MNPETQPRTDPPPDDGDPLIDEVRRVRNEISAEFGHDPYKLVEHYMQLQEAHRDRLVRGNTTRPPRSSTA